MQSRITQFIDTIVTDITALSPNESYYEGLRNTDTGTFEAIYTEFRRPITKAVTAAGGSTADGATFFRVALMQAVSLARETELDESIPASLLLKSLALAHFRDWAQEINLEQVSELPDSGAEAAYAIVLPDANARYEFRQKVRAKRQFTRLDVDCQKSVLELAKDRSLQISDPRIESNATAGCLKQYRKNLGISEDAWPEGMPDWAVSALTDAHFQKSWAIVEALDSRISMGLSATPEPESKVTRNVLILLGLILLGYGIWCYFNPSISPKQVYNENYKPPASIMADRAARLQNDELSAPPEPLCEKLFEEADEYYKREAYTDAAGILYTMIGDDMEDCKSDALYYLAIIGLQLNEPNVTIDCLAKIPDLDRFGEDLYWYQALAFVKIAAQNPLRRDIARRAVERARSNTEIPERRAQAEKMLEQLAD